MIGPEPHGDARDETHSGAAETVGGLGEFSLLRRIRGWLQDEARASSKPGDLPELILGAGDDAAILRPEAGWDQVVTCDTLVAGRHFLSEWTDARAIGRRAMTVNLSDIAAMGGEPRLALVSLGLPPAMPVAEVEGLYMGFFDALHGTGARVIGGNLTSVGGAGVADWSRDWFCDITLMGRVESGRALQRSGARPGDRILVTGSPGRSAAGLDLLAWLEKRALADSESGWEEHVAPAPDPAVLRARLRPALTRFLTDFPWAAPLVSAYVAPTARLQAGRWLLDAHGPVSVPTRAGSSRPRETSPSRRRSVTSLIDLSDGLPGDLLRLCEESGVAAVVDISKLPADPSLEEAGRLLNRPAWAWPSGPSDDYELLFTVDPSVVGRVSIGLRQACGLDVAEIGEIREGEPAVEIAGLPEGTRLPRGWDHFAC